MMNDTMAVAGKKKMALVFKGVYEVLTDKLILMLEVPFKIMRNLNPSSFFQSLRMKLFCK